MNNSRTLQLEKEIKEKNLLIGKLRHEGLSISASPSRYPVKMCCLCRGHSQRTLN